MSIDFVSRFAEAIATFEGFYKPGSLAKRNRNPGNIRSWGQLPQHRGFVIFPSEDAGFEALQAQIRKNIKRGLTVNEFFGGKPRVYPGYAPDSDGNHSKRYAAFVAKRLGISPDVVIADAMDTGSGR